MKIYITITILSVIVATCRAAHNCTSFNDKNHGFGCELRNVTHDGGSFEISMMAKDNTDKTEEDVVWVQIRDSQLDNLSTGVFEKFVNMEKIMIISSKGFQKLESSYFDKKIKLVLMKNTDLEVVGEKCFEGLNNLKTLSLNYNQVKRVHKRAFKDLVNMEKIEMVYNQIEFLDDDVFENNVNLKLILLYNNKLKVISAQLFTRNNKLESLQIQNNQITQIEKGFQANLTSLNRVDLSSNLCISENIQVTRYILWSSQQFKFKDCYSNFELMKSTNNVISSVNSRIEQLETNVTDAVKRVNGDMLVLEGKMTNSTVLDDFKTNLVNFFENDRKQMTQKFENDLNNVSSNVRVELERKVAKEVEDALTKTASAQQEKLVSDDFGSFREEFSGKFTFIYCLLFVMICFGIATTFVIFQKLNIFPIIGYMASDSRKLIDPEL